MDERPARPPRHRTRLPALLLIGLVALAAGLVGCGGSSNDSSGSSAADYQGEADSGAKAAAPAAPAGPKGVTTLGNRSRALVYTGELALTARDVPGTAGKAIQATLAAGGFVATDVRNSGKRPTVELTLRIPSARFTTMVDVLAKLGSETSRKLGTEDKQAATIDLDAQIASQRASVNRMRAFLDRASSLSELAQYESELTTRQTALATSESSRRQLADQVSYSTLTLHLEKPAVVIKREAEAKKAEWGPLVGLRNGWKALVAALTVVLTVGGWLAPFAVVGALVGVPAWVIWRRRPRPADPKPTPDPEPSSATPR